MYFTLAKMIVIVRNKLFVWNFVFERILAQNISVLVTQLFSDQFNEISGAMLHIAAGRVELSCPQTQAT